MILYKPTDFNVSTSPVIYRIRTCFLMTQLNDKQPEILLKAKKELCKILSNNNLEFIDADSHTTGKDFLIKIWNMVISVPIGIAIIHEGVSSQTMANIFYELGWMQALGKETLVIKVGDVKIPSDLIRTEYVQYDAKFEKHIIAYADSLSANADYYMSLANQLENNPLLAIDYYKRAFLLTGNEYIKAQAREICDKNKICNKRSKSSVENLMISWI